jgi:hypothetical protein
VGKFEKLKTKIDDITILRPTVFKDERGYFLEIYNRKECAEVGRNSSDEFNSGLQRPGFSVLDTFGTSEMVEYSLPERKDATDRFNHLIICNSGKKPGITGQNGA